MGGQETEHREDRRQSRRQRRLRVLRRESLRQRYEALAELPMVALALVMLGLFTAESLLTLDPLVATAVAIAQLLIWVIFAVDFAVRLGLADDRQRYLRRNWVAAMSVLLPPARMLRLARLAPLLRTARLARALGTVNRSLRALRSTLQRRRFGFVIAATVVVVIAAAAAVFGFERFAQESAITTPGSAIWWAAATVTTMSPPFDPVTAEGRILGLLLRIYAVAVFTYITATFAAYFIGVDTQEREGVGEIAARLDAIERHLARLEAHMASEQAGENGLAGSASRLGKR